MISDEFRKKFLEHQEERKNRSDYDIVLGFLRSYVLDFESSEILTQIKELTKNYPEDSLIELESLEKLVLTLPDKEIIDLVLWEANQPLDEPFSDNARDYLKNLANLIRASL
jgi:hypothetical protein